LRVYLIVFIIKEPGCWLEEINVVYSWLLDIKFVFKFVYQKGFLTLYSLLNCWWINLLQRILMLYLNSILDFDLFDTGHDLLNFLLFLLQPQILCRSNIIILSRLRL
jgi:hypothetical protein